MIKRITEKFSAKQYIVKLILILFTFFGFYLVVAWSSYTPFDPSWSVATTNQVTINKAGILGAWIIDFFFIFLGNIGHAIPFLILFVPIYFLKYPSQDITKLRLLLALLGVILLLCGFTTIMTIAFSTNYTNIEHHLPGGILGASLVMHFYDPLGKFALLLFSIIFITIGFLFCSGTSIINLLVKFYHWLTMKNDDLYSSEEEEVCNNTSSLKDNIANKDELEEIIFFKPEQEPQEHSNELVDVNQFININGLKNEQDNEVTHEINNQLEQPKMMSVEKKAVSQTPLFQEQSDQFTHSTDSIGELDFSNENLVDTLPDVKIVSSQKDFQQHVYGETDKNNEEDIDSLAHQFAELEQQRLKEMELRAKEINAEDTFNTIVGKESINEVEKMLVYPINRNKVQNVPTYNSYKDTLIHPALQQKVVIKAKPTTPMPSLDLLENRPTEAHSIKREEILETSQRIEQQLRNFNVKATVKDVLVGPVVTRYELELQPGVKASKVTNIDSDLARALMFRSIRVAEVIPGKPYIGIETPNTHRQTVSLKEVLDSNEFRNAKSLLTMALGKDISGKPVVVDLAKMPHLLVAGATGSGKSVGVNTMILSLLFRVKPEEVKFIMIDPKVVELSIYNDIPHLLTKVVTDMKKAANALRWCVDEMERRYQLLSALRVRNIEGFNDKIDEYNALGMPIPNPVWKPGDTMDTLPPPLEKLSYIVVIVDEFADLMMVAGKQVEELIARLAQKARAIGIHLILATQRPSVDVITGLIKANIPSRIAFTVASKIDSRTILDQGGAEALLGRGDMLYSGQGSSELIRVHGAFMSDDEVAKVADDWRARGKPDYIDDILESIDDEVDEGGSFGDGSDEVDDLFDSVVEFVTSTGTTSTSAVQRRFRVGFNRASRIMEQLEEQGIVSEMQNGKREILSRHSTDY